MSKIIMMALSSSTPQSIIVQAVRDNGRFKSDLSAEWTLAGQNIVIYFDPDDLTYKIDSGIPGRLITRTQKHCYSVEDFLTEVFQHYQPVDSYTHTRGGLGKYIRYNKEWYVLSESKDPIVTRWKLSCNQEDEFIPREVSNQSFEIFGFDKAVQLIAKDEPLEYFPDVGCGWRNVDDASVSMLKKIKFFRKTQRFMKVGAVPVPLPLTSFDDAGIVQPKDPGNSIKRNVFIVRTNKPEDPIEIKWKEGQMHLFSEDWREMLNYSLDAGLVHSNREHAIIHAKVLGELNKSCFNLARG